eukprot:173849-Prorocentrum_minimum.AAC.1
MTSLAPSLTTYWIRAPTAPASVRRTSQASKSPQPPPRQLPREHSVIKSLGASRSSPSVLKSPREGKNVSGRCAHWGGVSACASQDQPQLDGPQHRRRRGGGAVGQPAVGHLAVRLPGVVRFACRAEHHAHGRVALRHSRLAAAPAAGRGDWGNWAGGRHPGEGGGGEHVADPAHQAAGEFPSAVGEFPMSVGEFPTSVGEFPTLWRPPLTKQQVNSPPRSVNSPP